MRKARSFLFYRTSVGEVFTKLFDARHHLKYSFKEKTLKSDKEHQKYYLTKHYHIIEKGMALPEPRLGFGQPKILNVIDKTKNYEEKYGSDVLVSSIRKTLSEYIKLHAISGFNLPQDFKAVVDDFVGMGDLGDGGLKYLKKESASTLSLKEFDKFAWGRVSVRDFSIETVSEDVICSVVETARSTPSVCNRQGWKVHCYSDKSNIREILLYQNGNAGFTDAVDKLLIVTADAKAFTSYESNQVFIDGGLFSMNLLLALHAAGLGACPLNTCYPYFIEKKVKGLSSIPDNERLIMMIAVGCLKENYSVAYSTRNSIDQILVSH